jgi:hypothetical protein
MDLRVECGAHHEAGHIVIAAVQGLKLRPDGLMVGSDGNGVAVYCTTPEESDSSREAVILSTEAGYWADVRFCEEHSLPGPDANGPVMYHDHFQSLEILKSLSARYLAGEDPKWVYVRLQNRSKRLVEQHWLAIKELAAALLAKESQPMRPLKTGKPWTHSTAPARYLDGQEAVEVLARHGITAVCEERVS